MYAKEFLHVFSDSSLPLSRIVNLPTLNQLQWTSSQYATGNPDLVPEEAYKASLKTRLPLGIDASVFYTYYFNKIQWAPANLEKSYIYGFTLSNTYFTYNFTQSRLLPSNTPIMYIPVHTFAFRYSHKLSGLEFLLSSNYTSEVPDSNDNDSVLPSYNLYYLTIKYKPLTFIVNNIFNVSYITAKGYPTPPRSITVSYKLKLM